MYKSVLISQTFRYRDIDITWLPSSVDRKNNPVDWEVIDDDGYLWTYFRMQALIGREDHEDGELMTCTSLRDATDFLIECKYITRSR
jgi:hypothetical protein